MVSLEVAIRMGGRGNGDDCKVSAVTKVEEIHNHPMSCEVTMCDKGLSRDLLIIIIVLILVDALITESVMCAQKYHL